MRNNRTINDAAKTKAQLIEELHALRERNSALEAAVAQANELLARDLDERREWQRITLASIGDAVIVTDAHGRVTFMNPVAEALTGWQLPEAAGQELSTVFQIIDEDTSQPAESPAARVLRSGLIVGLANHTLLIARDGTAIPIDDSGAPIKDAAGTIVGVVLVFRDITQRRRAEEAQRFLAEAGNVLTGSLDYETTLARVARFAVPYLADWCAVHIREGDGAIRRLAVVHVDPDKETLARERPSRYPLDPNAQHIVPQVLRTGQPELFPEVPDTVLEESARDPEHLKLLRALGFQSYMCVPLLARGRVLGAITLVAAGSERRYGPDDLTLAEELARRAANAVDNAQLYREAQQAIRLRDQFLSIASHELKTPLTTLLGNAQLLLRRALREPTSNERDQRTIRIIADQATRLNKMVAALLDISRIQSGQLSIERAPFDLCALVRRVVEEVQPALEQHVLTCNTPSGTLLVEGDELRLEQVLQNLLGNAIKYSPSGGPIVVRVEQDMGHARITVTDQGLGIPRDELPRLFQRFYRAQNVESRHISGMGVGLFVVKEIVTLHDGTVEVQSDEGQGSTFTISLPLPA